MTTVERPWWHANVLSCKTDDAPPSTAKYADTLVQLCSNKPSSSIKTTFPWSARRGVPNNHLNNQGHKDLPALRDRLCTIVTPPESPPATRMMNARTNDQGITHTAASSTVLQVNRYHAWLALDHTMTNSTYSVDAKRYAQHVTLFGKIAGPQGWEARFICLREKLGYAALNTAFLKATFRARTVLEKFFCTDGPVLNQ